MADRTSFLSRQRDVIASFSFGVWNVQMCFLQRDVFEVYQRISPFYELLSLFPYLYEFYHHYVLPCTEKRNLRACYGPVRQSQEMCQMYGEGGGRRFLYYEA